MGRVGHLIYYHIVPPLILLGQKTLFLNDAEDIFPGYTVGQDGVDPILLILGRTQIYAYVSINQSCKGIERVRIRMQLMPEEASVRGQYPCNLSSLSN